MPIRNLSDLKRLLPLSTEPEAAKAFATYRHYLVHIERCLGGEYGVGGSLEPGVVSVVRAAPKFSRIGRPALSHDEAQRLQNTLRIAWAKELQLRIPGAFDADLLPFLIHGSGIHAYYVVFHAARALITVAGQAVAPSHSATLATLSSWTKDRDLFPVPWSVRSEGGPSRSAMWIAGKPSYAITSGGVSPLSTPTPVTVWDSLDMLLFTTRDRQIKDRKRQWREKNKRFRVPANEAAKLCRNLPATTLFNVLYRLRTRSDYSDADAFLDGIPTTEAAAEFHSAICTFVHGTLVVLETLVVAYAGPDVYSDAADRFLKQAPGPASDALRTRKTAIVGP